MIKKHIRLEMESNAQTIDELKCVVGFLMTQLTPDSRQAVIDNLKEFGLNDSAKEFTQFL